MFKRTWERIKCAFGKHQRGVKIDGPRDAMINGELQHIVVYQCGRCLDTWTRKVRKVLT